MLERLNEKAPQERWKKHRVFAVDGSRIALPHATEILSHFPANNTHYPKGLLVTGTDVMTGVIRVATVAEEFSSERDLLVKISDDFKAGDLLLLDRGFEGFETWSALDKKGLKFVCRVRTAGCYSRGVNALLKSGAREKIYEIGDGADRLTIRYVRAGTDFRGRAIVLATNLLEKKSYTSKEIRQIYQYRWKVETAYYRVKELLNLEKFHAKTLNGVLQEIWANLFVLSMTSILSHQAKAALKTGTQKVISFKNALEVLASNLHFFVCCRSVGSRRWAKLIMGHVEAITFTHQPGRKNPRLSKQPHTTWVNARKNKTTDNFKKRKGWLL